jgi:very-short-patch-repair endonuclease
MATASRHSGIAAMLHYKGNLKVPARQLRRSMTDTESVLWSRLRSKQLLAVQVYRQKPIGPYIVDFYAHRCKLVIEVDGSQHMDKDQAERDRERDEYLESAGIKVLRFNNRQVLEETDAVVEVIYQAMKERLNG